jgi:uncharacterized protein (TIGR03905 family)
MTTYDYQPQHVCARNIHITLSDDKQTIEDIAFEGGCNGNLKAIGRLVKGRPVDEVVELLQGNTCGKRDTSCADQLTKGLRAAQNA